MKQKKSILLCVLPILLSALLGTWQTTKTKIPPLKGLYTLFEPDTIGIGQALLYSQWVENVWTYAPTTDAAHQLIKEFWHKISEYDNFLPTQKFPVAAITPEILGKLIAYASNIEEEKEYKDEIVNLWLKACEDAIATLAHETIVTLQKNKPNIENLKKNLVDMLKKPAEITEHIKRLEKEIKTNQNILNFIKTKPKAALKIKTNKLQKEIETKEQTIQKINKTLKNLLPEQRKHTLKKIKKLQEQIKSQKQTIANYLDKKTPEPKKIETLEKESETLIENLEKKTKHLEETAQKKQYDLYKKALDKITEKAERLENNAYMSLEHLDITRKDKIETIKSPQTYLKTKIKEKIEAILEKIKNLSKQEGQNYIIGITKAILWAYFEDKFKTKQEFDICLKELDKKIGNELYSSDECEKFEDEISKLTPPIQIITKIMHAYDFSTYSTITRAKIKTVPPQVKQATIPYEYAEKQKTRNFPTCFESSILDTISVLFYDPTDNTYNKQLLEQYPLLKNLFEANKSEKHEPISPDNINQMIQKWINTVSGLDNIAYSENINGTPAFNLNCSFENFIKIANHFFDLGLEIEQNQRWTLNLNVENIKEVEKPETAEEFWMQLFEYVSAKLSSEQRIINFTPESSKEIKFTTKNFEFKNSVITTQKTTGVISIQVRYQDFKYQVCNFNFNIHIRPGHAWTTCPKREDLGLKIYNDDFKELLSKIVYLNFYTNDYRLIPLFLLLTNINTEIRKKDIPILNLICYSLNFKNGETKFNFLQKSMHEKLLIETPFEGLLPNLIRMLPEDPIYLVPIYALIGTSSIEQLKKELQKNITKFQKKYPTEFAFEYIDLGNAQPLEKLLKLKNLDPNAILRQEGETLLQKAVAKNDAESVAILLKHPTIDVNLQKYENRIPLNRAITNKNIKIIKLLLGHPKINIHKIMSLEYSPLIEAVLGGDHEIINLLLNHPKINMINEKDWQNLLIIAINKNNPAIIELVLNHLKINLKYPYHTLVIEKAIKTDNPQVVRLLLNKVDLDSFIENILLDYLKYGDNKEIKTAINEKLYPLHKAAIDNDIEAVRTILKNKKFSLNMEADLDGNGRKTALEYAIERGNILIAALLINSPRIDIFFDVDNVIDAINKSPEKDAMRELIIKRYFPLHFYIRINDQKLLQEQLNKSDEWNKNNTDSFYGETPLTFAVQKNNMRIIKTLLDDKEIDATKKNEAGKSPLDLAQTDEVRELIKKRIAEQKKK